MVNEATLSKLSQLANKFGRPIVQWADAGLQYNFVKRVAVCTSMNSPHASHVSIVFGDASYCYIRRVNDGLSGVRVLRERYADSGQIGPQTISRWDFKLGIPVIAVHSAFSILQQSSELHRLTTRE